VNTIDRICVDTVKADRHADEYHYAGGPILGTTGSWDMMVALR